MWEGREVYGARKTWLELNRQGIVVARCTVERLMRDLGIHGARGRRKRPRTTVPGDPAGMPQDLLERGAGVLPGILWPSLKPVLPAGMTVAGSLSLSRCIS